MCQDTFEVLDSHFESNRATSDSQWVKESMLQGGAIHLSVLRPDITLMITGNDFVDNAAYFGGALHILTPQSSIVEITACNFRKNQARAAGGAVVLRNTGSTVWSANSVVGNTAGLGGGILLTNNAHFTGVGQSRAEDGTPVGGQPLVFENNTAVDGGAIACVYCGMACAGACADDAAIESQTLLLCNKLRFPIGPTVIQDPILEGNFAARNGGGASVENALSDFFLQQLVAKENHAIKGGGVFVNSAPNFRISSATFPDGEVPSIFEGNQATSGGGLYFSAEHRQANKVVVSVLLFISGILRKASHQGIDTGLGRFPGFSLKITWQGRSTIMKVALMHSMKLLRNHCQ